jgi:hypothetical protein
MNKDTLRQLTNALSVLLALTVNILASTLPLNGQNTGEISDRFQVYFVPAGYVFAIWGIIYIGNLPVSIGTEGKSAAAKFGLSLRIERHLQCGLAVLLALQHLRLERACHAYPARPAHRQLSQTQRRAHVCKHRRKMERGCSFQRLPRLDLCRHRCQRHRLSLLYQLGWIRDRTTNLGSHPARDRKCARPGNDGHPQGQRLRLRVGLVVRWDRSKAGRYGTGGK